MIALALLAALQAPDGLIASPEAGWPQWCGKSRDGISEEKGLLRAWPEGGPKLLWKTGDLGRGWSSPIVSGGRIYITGDVGDELVLRALDLDGKPLWRAVNGRAWKGEFPGSRAAFVISEGRLYLMNAHGRVACLEADTGKELWAVEVLERFEGRNITWAMSECLLVDGPRLIVTPGGKKGLMAALDKATGKTLWVTPAIEGEQATYSSPILLAHGGRRLLVNCSSGVMFAANADSGALLWTVPLKNQYGTNVSSPVYADGLLHVATAYFEGGGWRLGAGAKPERAWASPLDTCTGGFVVADGVLYGSGYSKFKYWIAVDWKTGERRAHLRELASGSAIWADGRLTCLAQDGRAALVTPLSEGFTIAGQFSLTGEPVSDAWAHPVLLDGRLYLRYHETLACYGVR